MKFLFFLMMFHVFFHSLQAQEASTEQEQLLVKSLVVAMDAIEESPSIGFVNFNLVSNDNKNALALKSLVLKNDKELAVQGITANCSAGQRKEDTLNRVIANCLEKAKISVNHASYPLKKPLLIEGLSLGIVKNQFDLSLRLKLLAWFKIRSEGRVHFNEKAQQLIFDLSYFKVGKIKLKKFLFTILDQIKSKSIKVEKNKIIVSI